MKTENQKSHQAHHFQNMFFLPTVSFWILVEVFDLRVRKDQKIEAWLPLKMLCNFVSLSAAAWTEEGSFVQMA